MGAGYSVIRQLMVWGLTPHKIHSRVGCSSEIGIYRQPQQSRRTTVSLKPICHEHPLRKHSRYNPR